MNTPIVAVVGAGPALSEMSRGILRRCGFIVIEAPSLEEALGLVRHGPAPTFVVIMLHRLAGDAKPEENGSLAAFLEAAQSTIKPDRVIAVSEKSTFPGDMHRYESLGVQIFSARRFSFRLLARFLIDLQGGDGGRCCPGPNEREFR